MNKETDYTEDLAEIRTMMERSTKFISLSGWAGVMAGIYAIIGATVASRILNFNPDSLFYYMPPRSGSLHALSPVISLAFIVLILAVGTAVLLSWRKANKQGERAWNPASKRLVNNMIVPLFAGGYLINILVLHGLVGLAAPLSLLFYGLSLFVASNFTFIDVKYLGLIQISLGLLSAVFIEYSLFIWALGFGGVHIGYGLYIHMKYER